MHYYTQKEGSKFVLYFFDRRLEFSTEEELNTHLKTLPEREEIELATISPEERHVLQYMTQKVQKAEFTYLALAGYNGEYLTKLAIQPFPRVQCGYLILSTDGEELILLGESLSLRYQGEDVDLLLKMVAYNLAPLPEEKQPIRERRSNLSLEESIGIPVYSCINDEEDYFFIHENPNRTYTLVKDKTRYPDGGWKMGAVAKEYLSLEDLRKDMEDYTGFTEVLSERLDKDTRDILRFIYEQKKEEVKEIKEEFLGQVIPIPRDDSFSPLSTLGDGLILFDEERLVAISHDWDDWIDPEIVFPEVTSYEGEDADLIIASLV